MNIFGFKLKVSRLVTIFGSGFMEILRDPVDHSKVKEITSEAIYFMNGQTYIRHKGIPVLIDERNSLFQVQEIVKSKPTTQNKSYRNQKNFKNFVRQKFLPSLSKDFKLNDRYKQLSNRMENGFVLILGAGDKAAFYRQSFSKLKVIITDVHALFDVDLILDAHQLPFEDNTFSAIVLPQVLEHTARPWVVVSELQRVIKPGGAILVEVPFSYPYHSMPYDFFRFTPTALRFLFSKCSMEKVETPEGNWSGAATLLSNSFINLFSKRCFRISAMVFTRLAFGWLKFIDRFIPNQKHLAPKGTATIFVFDGIERKDIDMLREIEENY